MVTKGITGTFTLTKKGLAVLYAKKHDDPVFPQMLKVQNIADREKRWQAWETLKKDLDSRFGPLNTGL